MSSTSIQMEASWLAQLEGEFEKPYMKALREFLKVEKSSGKIIYPKGKEFFNAFSATPLKQVRVVILGQDPYHGPGQAHGLSFSVPKGIAVPPSLQNMYKELASDIGFNIPVHGNLEAWAKQGVLLLNSVLSVQAGLAASHQKKGWEQFTDAVIATINEQCENVVFLLWGAYAQRKGAVIDTHRHCILKAPHPSPLSAHRGFLGCKHFSKANEYLESCGKSKINWCLT